jgi:hypothetical protein
VVIVTLDLSALEAGPAADHDPAWRDDDGSDGGVLKFDHLSPEVSRLVVARLTSKDFAAWTDALARVGNCARSVRLRGTCERMDLTTGEVLSSFSSADTPLGWCTCGAKSAGVGVPVLLPAVRRGHVPPDPGRGDRRQDCPRVGGRPPTALSRRSPRRRSGGCTLPAVATPVTRPPAARTAARA